MKGGEKRKKKKNGNDDFMAIVFGKGKLMKKVVSLKWR